MMSSAAPPLSCPVRSSKIVVLMIVPIFSTLVTSVSPVANPDPAAFAVLLFWMSWPVLSIVTALASVELPSGVVKNSMEPPTWSAAGVPSATNRISAAGVSRSTPSSAKATIRPRYSSSVTIVCVPSIAASPDLTRASIGATVAVALKPMMATVESGCAVP